MGKSIRFEKKTMGARVHYTRHNSWNTRSNKFRQVRTPGGRLAVQYVAKRLGGLNRMRPQNYRRIHKHYRRVSRAYGGVYDHSEVKNRIIRTFLTEEVKNVKKTMALQASLEAKKNKKTKKGAKGGAKKKVAKK